ncbi:MAG: aldo/keto reductase [Caldilineae bacterium]|nr:MAG: aldo/keto reductase [Caldilineae bacterium]
MEYRAFGATGLQVSAIGFGCWEMGGTYGPIEEKDVIDAVHRGIDLGINIFDTAEDYGKGRSEEFLAKALGPRRKEIILVTKFGIGYEGGRDASRARVHRAIEGSLRRLKTDYVDVYLVHWPDRNTPFEETMLALDEIVQAGKARFVGVSNFTPAELRRAHAARRVDVVQYGYSLFDRRMARWIFPYARQENMGVMGYGSLAYGLLAGAFTEDTVFGENDWRRHGGGNFSLRLFAPGVFQRNVQAVNELAAIAKELGKSLPQLAINWVLANQAVSTALVGVRRISELEDNLGAVGWRLDDDVKHAIDRVFAKYEIDTAPNTWVEADLDLDIDKEEGLTG